MRQNEKQEVCRQLLFMALAVSCFAVVCGGAGCSAAGGKVIAVAPAGAFGSRSAPPMPVQSAAGASATTSAAFGFAVAPVVPKPATNGIVTLAWDAGVPADSTTITNLTLGTAYKVGNVATVTLGKQLVGTNTYQAYTTEGGATAFSAPLTATIAADTNRLTISARYYVNCIAGMLQSSTNLIYWKDVKTVTNAEQVELVGPEAQKFYRVRIK